jgi:hypothetical protein
MKTIPGSRNSSYLATVGVFLIIGALIAGVAGCDSDYNPAPSKDLQISTWYDLDDIRDNLAGNHVLINDLDSTTAGYAELAGPTANGGKGWDPLSLYHLGLNIVFTGSFDGNGHQIRDLFIYRPDELAVGLFGLVGEGGVVKNAAVVNATVTGGGCAGGLVGANAGTLSSSYAGGTITGDECVGGLVGINDLGVISDSHCAGSVTGGQRVGGLVGDNRGAVSDSYSTAGVTGSSAVGGLAGSNTDGGSVDNSFYDYDGVLINGENVITIGALFHEDLLEWLAKSKSLSVSQRLSHDNDQYVVNNVTDFKELLAFGQNATLKFRLNSDLDLAAEPGFYIPYLAGQFDGNGHEISNASFSFAFVVNVGLFGCTAPGAIVTSLAIHNANIGGNYNVGSLVGLNMGSVTNCCSDGSVSGITQSVGGLIGDNEGTLNKSYSAVTVSGDDEVGGLVGLNNGMVSDCYSTGGATDISALQTLVGSNMNSIYDSGTPPPIPDTIGGLVGENHGDVIDSYSTGMVMGDESARGLVGKNTFGTVSNSFWDIETSGQIESDGGVGKPTAQMKDQTTFSGAGWDIITVALNETNLSYIWNIVDGVTYPFLSWESV